MSRLRRLPGNAPAAGPAPIDSSSIVTVRVPGNGGVPNHPMLAAMLCPGVLAADADVQLPPERVRRPHGRG